MIRFCTYFDSNYLVRGLTLCRSIVAHLPDCEIWILCFDERTHDAVRAFDVPQLRPISTASLHAYDNELAFAVSTRTLIESYFTSTPSWCRYVFDQADSDDLICYVDADLFFYRTPMAALAELGTGSILVIPHRFPPGPLFDNSRGIFNVGLVAFRKGGSAKACIERWRRQCLAACSDGVRDGSYADQKYLDDWPETYPDVVVSQQLGSCVAPWNVSQFLLAPDQTAFTVNGEPLIFFHFHGMTVFAPWLYDSGVHEYGGMEPKAERALYSDYLEQMRKTVQELRSRGVNVQLRDWVWRRRRRSVLAVLRKLARARVSV